MKRVVLLRKDFKNYQKWDNLLFVCRIRGNEITKIHGIELGAFEDSIGVVTLYDADGNDITDNYNC